jgi:hypothetical protein
MQINRHNYETYFLLWIDGELSDAEMEMVERFVNEHPDLAEELAALQETKLPLDDSIVFLDKESLLKVEQPALSMSSYETYFLLYVDNELTAKEKEEVELFVLQHPQLQAEFMLLKQTKLEPETIVFANKELLYRKEEKEKPVIYMQWKRIAIAAALIGLIFSLWMIVPNKSTNESTQTLASTDQIRKNQPIGNINNGEHKREQFAQPSKNEPIESKLIAATVSNNEKKQDQLIATNSKSIDEIVANETIVTERAEEVTASTNTRIEPVINNVQTNNELSKNPILARATVTEDEQPNNLIKQAVYRELDTDESSKSLYVGSLEINKDKLRGIIRKAGSIFRSKSKQDEDKIVTNK